MRRWLSLLLAVCLGLSLTGCQPQEEEPEPSPSETASPVPTRSPETVQFSLGYDPGASLHPITGDSQVNQDLTGLVYQGLYELDNEFVPQPVLADSGAPGEDGYSWTFTMSSSASSTFAASASSTYSSAP